MIAIIARGDQLTVPIHNVHAEDFIMILSDGTTLRPMNIQPLSKYCKRYLVAFDIPEEKVVQERKDFAGLETDLLEFLGGGSILVRLFDFLAISKNVDSKYLTITQISRCLRIPWGNARLVMKLLVEWGAYTKYRHTWKRSPSFYLWVKKWLEG